LADLGRIVRFALGYGRSEESQRTDFAAVESYEHGHVRLLAAIEHFDELPGQHMSVDCSERKVTCERRLLSDRVCVNRPQAREVARFQSGGELRDARLGG